MGLLEKIAWRTRKWNLKINILISANESVQGNFLEIFGDSIRSKGF